MAAYCSQCGEKRLERDDWKLRNIVSETFSELVNVEHSKLWQTLRLLVCRPGQLTREYWEGRRNRFIGPVKLYLIFFALMLLLYSIHQGTAVFDVRSLAAADPNGTISARLERYSAEREVPMPLLVQEVNSRWQSYMSASQLAYPLFMALGLKLLFYRRGLHFAEHLIFALHVLAFLYFLLLAFWPFYFFFGGRDPSGTVHHGPLYVAMTGASMAWSVVYLLLALRRAYGQAWLPALAKGSVVFLIYIVTWVLFASAALAMAISRAQPTS